MYMRYWILPVSVSRCRSCNCTYLLGLSESDTVHHTAGCNVILHTPILKAVTFGSESRRPRLSDTDQSSLPKVNTRPTSARSGERSLLGSASCIRTFARSPARMFTWLVSRQCKLTASQASRRVLAPRARPGVGDEGAPDRGGLGFFRLASQAAGSASRDLTAQSFQSAAFAFAPRMGFDTSSSNKPPDGPLHRGKTAALGLFL